MTPEFIKSYTEALNRSTQIMAKLQSKGVLQAGIDDQLIIELNEAQAEVKAFNDQLLAMNQQNLRES